MKTIFIGLIFACLDFNLDLGNCRIGLIPDFIGYYMIMKGIREMEEENEFFEKVLKLSKIMLIYSVIIYVLDIFGITSQLDIIGTILGIAATILNLMVTYNLTKGIEEIENRRLVDMNSVNLLKYWKLVAVTTVISWVLMFIPVLAAIAIIVALIGNICYLYAFHKSRLAYEMLPL